LFSGSGLTQGARGETGISCRKLAYGLRATPTQTAALYQAPIADYKPGYGVTDTTTSGGAAVAPEAALKPEKVGNDKLSNRPIDLSGLCRWSRFAWRSQSEKGCGRRKQAAEEQKAHWRAVSTKRRRAATCCGRPESLLPPVTQSDAKALQRVWRKVLRLAGASVLLKRLDSLKRTVRNCWKGSLIRIEVSQIAWTALRLGDSLCDGADEYRTSKYRFLH
jgi:hypothetical protein